MPGEDSGPPRVGKVTHAASEDRERPSGRQPVPGHLSLSALRLSRLRPGWHLVSAGVWTTRGHPRRHRNSSWRRAQGRTSNLNSTSSEVGANLYTELHGTGERQWGAGRRCAQVCRDVSTCTCAPACVLVLVSAHLGSVHVAPSCPSSLGSLLGSSPPPHTGSRWGGG